MAENREKKKKNIWRQELAELPRGDVRGICCAVFSFGAQISSLRCAPKCWLPNRGRYMRSCYVRKEVSGSTDPELTAAGFNGERVVDAAGGDATDRNAYGKSASYVQSIASEKEADGSRGAQSGRAATTTCGVRNFSTRGSVIWIRPTGSTSRRPRTT